MQMEEENVSGLRMRLFQGVVTYMSRVEAFATGIKTESSDQSPLGGLIKESR